MFCCIYHSCFDGNFLFVYCHIRHKLFAKRENVEDSRKKRRKTKTKDGIKLMKTREKRKRKMIRRIGYSVTNV